MATGTSRVVKMHKGGGGFTWRRQERLVRSASRTWRRKGKGGAIQGAEGGCCQICSLVAGSGSGLGGNLRGNPEACGTAGGERTGAGERHGRGEAASARHRAQGTGWQAAEGEEAMHGPLALLNLRAIPSLTLEYSLIPRSVTTALWRPSISRMLLGFMSRWMMPGHTGVGETQRRRRVRGRCTKRGGHRRVYRGTESTGG